MTSGAKVRATVGLAWAAVACSLLPAFGQEISRSAVRVDSDNIAVLGVTLPKAPPNGIVSVRNPKSELRSADGDTYDAAGLVQDVTSAWFLDDVPHNHTFGTGPESAGMNMLSQVNTVIVGSDYGPGVPETNLLQVNYFTEDSSDIVPVGSISPNQTFFVTWRFDVGAGDVGTDQINWTPSSGFTVVESGFCVAVDGEILGCFELAEDTSDSNGVSGVGAVNLGGEDIAGFGIDEMIMYWQIQAGSSCGDGQVDAGEQCDDGNAVGGDGCSASCQFESAGPGDLDGDGDVDLDDFAEFLLLFNGSR